MSLAAPRSGGQQQDESLLCPRARAAGTGTPAAPCSQPGTLPPATAPGLVVVGISKAGAAALGCDGWWGEAPDGIWDFCIIPKPVLCICCTYRWGLVPLQKESLVGAVSGLLCHPRACTLGKGPEVCTEAASSHRGLERGSRTAPWNRFSGFLIGKIPAAWQGPPLALPFFQVRARSDY